MSLNNTKKICINLPSTRSTTKRLNSNSTLSPKQDDKNQNCLVSPNKFAILAKNDTCDYSNTSTLSNSSEDDLIKSPHTDQVIDSPTQPTAKIPGSHSHSES